MRMIFRTKRKDLGGGGTGPGGGVEPQLDTITVGTNGQTNFTLSGTPETPSETAVIFQGIEHLYGVDFTVSGNVMTWLNNEFSFSAGEVVKIRYFITVP